MTFKFARLGYLALSISLVATASLAVTKNWNDGTGSWSVPGNWSPTGVPGASDVVNIVPAAGGNTITYDYIGPDVTLGSLNVDFTGAGTNPTTLAFAPNVTDLTVGNGETVGASGRGAVNQSSGVQAISGAALNIGLNPGSNGAFALGFNAELLMNYTEVVGNSGTGTFTNDGGYNVINGGYYLYVGANAGSNGTYTLKDGGSVNVSGNEIIGGSGTGLFNNVDGYQNQVGGELDLGVNVGATGTYSFGNTSNSFQDTSAANVYVGGSSAGAGGQGTLNVAGGTLTTAGNLTVYNTGVSAVNLTGGTINAGSLNLLGNLSRFNWTAGTLNLTNSDTIIDNTAAATHVTSLALSATKSLGVSGDEYVGYSGALDATQTGGSNTVGERFRLAYQPTSTATYTLSGNGNLSANAERIGELGNATFTQKGGTNTVTTDLLLGYSGNSSGTYNLNGGTLTVGGLESVGFNDDSPGTTTGVFNQTGGLNNAGSLVVGHFSPPSTIVPGSGTYNLSGGVVLANSALIGDLVPGTFNQTGGSVHIDGFLDLGGFGTGSTGTYNLSAGSLQVDTGAYFTNHGTSFFNQTGGSLTINEGLVIGYDRAVGTYSLSGGSGVISGGLQLGFDGGSGTGVATVSGSGALTVTGGITISHSQPGTVLNLAGGTINTDSINDHAVPSLFNWTAGTLNITSDVAWDSGAALDSTSVIFGPALALNSSQTLIVSGNETIGGSGAFDLAVGNGTHTVTGNITLLPTGSLSEASGGTLNYANFTQAGGSINGTFRNSTNFIYQGGVFSAQMINDGTISFGSSFAINVGLQNNSAMTVANGQTLTVQGTGINNLGSFALNGGTIGTGGTFTNAVGGTLTAHGMIKSPLVNHGTMIVEGVLSTSSSFTNDGILQGAGTVTPTGSFSNSAGGVINATNPNAALVFTNFANNNAGAVMNVGPTSTLSLGTNWTNSGIVNLQGSGSRLAGGSITNNGTIQGFGTITASLSSSNTGIFRASGGELDLTTSGFSNLSTSQIQVFANSTFMVLQGMTSNSSPIALTGGTFDNNNHPLINNGTINGYGTIRTSGLTNSSGKLLGVGEGNMDVFGNFTNQGVVNIQTGRTAYFYNTVNGSGSFTGGGTAVFLASLSPGNSPATVSIAGGATLVGGTSLSMELGGPTPGTQYDQLHVGGLLSIGGILSVSLINGFLPAVGNSFDLLDWGTLSGTFSSLSLPTLANGQWDTSQLYTTGVLSVVAGSTLAGDYNHNGVVDAADYVAWRHGLGTTYTQTDYDVWRTNFGATAASGSETADMNSATAVPEPASIALIVLASLACCFFRRSA